jgi:hypothetical protein
MDIKEICPCPNLTCPNHGCCDNCTSRHLKLGYLNYCGFNTILPVLQNAIQVSPDSETAKQLSAMIERLTQAYSALMQKNELTQEHQRELLKKITEYSPY